MTKRNDDDTRDERGFESVWARGRLRLRVEARDMRRRYSRLLRDVRSKLHAGRRFIRAHRSLETALVLAACAPLLILACVVLLAVHYWSDAGSIAGVATRSPSRLYGAPIVLQEGKPIEPSVVERVLQDRHYRRARLPGVEYGTYRLEDDGTMLVGLRRYPAPVDGFRGDATVRITHSDGIVRSIDVDGVSIGERPLPFEPPLLATYYGPDLRDSIWVDLEQFPPDVIAAVLATEDEDYMEHNGISIAGIVRAAWANLRAGETRQGGSTITQQLVKNLLGWKERTLWRKVREAIVAMLVEARFEKPEILEAYLNEIYLGTRGSIHLIGIGSASRAWFGKDVRELTLDEAAVLAGMIRSPGRYSPARNAAAALERRNHVLGRMLDSGFITEAEHRLATGAPLRVIEEQSHRNLAPYFARQVVREAARDWGIEDLNRGGYAILSSLRLADQRAADRAVVEGLEALGGKALQGALVSVDPRTGEILAWVGGRDFDASQFDRVASARRQLGSLFKPVVYASALRNSGLHPFDFVDDSPIAVVFDGEIWIPKNSDRRFRGRTTLRDALEDSLNVPTVRVAVHSGLDPIVDLARRMGIEAEMESVPSLALGAIDTTPLEAASVYATIAGDGVRRPIHGIRAIIDSSGAAIEPVVTAEPVQVLDERELVYLRSLLHGAVTRGTGWKVSRLRLGPAVGGKTGTSSDDRDAWFAGFTPDRATVVWVGRDDGRPARLSGARAALPIWGSFTKTVAPGQTTARWRLPRGFQDVRIDPTTGYLATESCPQQRFEVYPDALRPATDCVLHQARQPWFTRLFADQTADASARGETDTTEPSVRSVVIEREMLVDGIRIIDLSAHANPLELARDETPARIELLDQPSPPRAAAGPGGD